MQSERLSDCFRVGSAGKNLVVPSVGDRSTEIGAVERDRRRGIEIQMAVREVSCWDSTWKPAALAANST